MSNQELAERIKAARKSVGLHMTELAERIGVSSNYISLLERAERNPSDAVLNKIAEAYRFAPFMIEFENIVSLLN